MHYVGTVAAEARRAFGSMAARDSLDDIRDEDDSRSDSDFSDKQAYGDLSISSAYTTDIQQHTPAYTVSNVIIIKLFYIYKYHDFDFILLGLCPVNICLVTLI